MRRKARSRRAGRSRHKSTVARWRRIWRRLRGLGRGRKRGVRGRSRRWHTRAFSTTPAPNPPVILRRWKGKGGSVIALFPTLSAGRGLVTSYEHIGQHGGADMRVVMHRTRAVSGRDLEAKELLSELRGRGYRGLRTTRRAKRRKRNPSTTVELQTPTERGTGRWTLLDTDGAVMRGWDNVEDVRDYLRKSGMSIVLMDVDGNGTMRMVPTEWIGDGQPLIGSARAMALI